MTPRVKCLEFRGSSLIELRDFPLAARRSAGHQLDRLQQGLVPSDFKPMPDIGRGVEEIRLNDESGEYRVIYICRLTEAVFVLHCFQKKEQRTRKTDIELARARYRDLMKERNP
ncbi:MAG: type II toxin-antitoxin system RelE/ParE family toxin [Xanthomonadales bacterium]|jgi:phage-related protein|nr:type II toxin-antitoxin system RelE/ParE family toxin [Xanthomonadales bacterium]MBK7144781.1 type II toxin-antitoxin system RelE/ParE family toxin [Xanthomonadales bacterium]MCC6562284.1 type II toxin-antitoxin system RelE/ParE family toxin [Xanthomonadales bacterium]